MSKIHLFSILKYKKNLVNVFKIYYSFHPMYSTVYITPVGIFFIETTYFLIFCKVCYFE